MIASRSSLGGGFPGLAVFSLLGLLLVLGAAVLLILRPWEATTRDPHLSVSPGVGVGLGDAVVVSRPGLAHDGTGGVAVAIASPAAPSGGTSPAPSHSGARLAVAQLQPVAVESPPPSPVSPPAGPAPAPPPEMVEAPPVPPAPPPPTLVTEPERGVQQPRPPVNAGADPESECEGDVYEVGIAFDPEVTVDGGGEVEIVIRRLGDEDGEGEVHLVGELGDVVELLEAFVSEGDCAQVEVELGEEEPLVFEIPDELTALEEALEPFLP